MSLCYAECHNSECRYIMLIVIKLNAVMYAEYHYGDCCYAESANVIIHFRMSMASCQSNPMTCNNCNLNITYDRNDSSLHYKTPSKY